MLHMANSFDLQRFDTALVERMVVCIFNGVKCIFMNSTEVQIRCVFDDN